MKLSIGFIRNIHERCGAFFRAESGIAGGVARLPIKKTPETASRAVSNVFRAYRQFPYKALAFSANSLEFAPGEVCIGKELGESARNIGR
jgi:hypothetical protein